ncbi:nuclear transport factor 2 family protein [Ruegeria lacuscaerulensis]|uniref:nuclear transport factor 2 family protein n=1 Tax=Ruegeria lacuscaerulensis TaxID=55218 RepID=UPI00147B5E98|nr:nuclear transport factor 2 family protein [Ruegeria lacuscaerulensis]
MLFAEALEKASSYAAVWSSNDPMQVAAHYAENGVARLNSGNAIQGRAAIASDYAKPFFRDFPKSSVLQHDFRISGNHALFTGMLVGPGRPEEAPIRLLEWEEWTLDDNGLIQLSLVWFDREDHARQGGSAFS